LKLLLDTTYLLPTVGISIKGLSKDALITLNTKGHEIAISQISLFELSAKGAKYVLNKELLPERVTRGIRSLFYDDIIEKIPTYDSKILLTAFILRSLMVDFIDCLILSTALNCCDALITEDQGIQNLKKNKRYLELLSTINPNFKIQTISETK
jgi:PIN domain nuclease of toxin-antitoxin system